MPRKQASQKDQIPNGTGFTDEEAVMEIGSYLTYGREIPNYYFRRELRAMGLANETVNGTAPRRWVGQARQVRLDAGIEIGTAAEMYRRIHERTKHQPREETHLEARGRLQEMLTALQQRQINTTTIAARIDVSPKVVQKQATFGRREDTYTTTCPWETIDRIIATDWEQATRPQPLPTAPVTSYSITEGEVQRERHRDEEARRLRGNTENHYIDHGGSCWNCGASWANLSPERHRRKGTRDMRCRVCSRTARLRTARD